MICVPLPAKQVPLVMCVPLPDMCSPTQETHIPSEMCFPKPGTHIPSDMCNTYHVEEHISLGIVTGYRKHIPLKKHISGVACVSLARRGTDITRNYTPVNFIVHFSLTEVKPPPNHKTDKTSKM